MSVGDDGYKEFAANITGPLLGDTLSFKLGWRFYEYDGQYTGRSSDGRNPTFGAEQTKRVSGALRWAPSDGFDVTVRAFEAQNSDGLYNNIIFKTLNCFQTAPGARGGSFCGEIPEIPLNGGSESTSPTSSAKASPASLRTAPCTASRPTGMWVPAQ